MLRRIFEPKREEVAWYCGQLHDEELDNLYLLTNIVRTSKSMTRSVGHVARLRERRNTYKTIVRKLEGKKPRGRRRDRWKDSIKMDCKEICWKVVDWIHSGYERDKCAVVVNTEMNLRLHKFLTSCATIRFQRRTLLCGFSRPKWNTRFPNELVPPSEENQRIQIC
jgi:hypothetical protein